jgi:hypothetical protein
MAVIDTTGDNIARNQRVDARLGEKFDMEKARRPRKDERTVNEARIRKDQKDALLLKSNLAVNPILMKLSTSYTCEIWSACLPTSRAGHNHSVPLEAWVQPIDVHWPFRA